MSDALRFQRDTPKDGQLTLGFVVHITQLARFQRAFPDARIQGWVVEDEIDSEGEEATNG